MQHYKKFDQKENYTNKNISTYLRSTATIIAKGIISGNFLQKIP